MAAIKISHDMMVDFRIYIATYLWEKLILRQGRTAKMR